jgi:SAM-dependent methyltransferase
MSDDVELENLINATNHKAVDLRLLDWAPMQFKDESMFIGLQHIIKLGEDNKAISKGLKVLDLGSGNGISSLIWANAGYEVTGIELHPELVDIAQDAVLQANTNYLINTIPKFYSGSYFPKKYIDMRNQNVSKAIFMENEFIENSFQNKDKSYVENFHPVCSTDVYETNDIDIKEFDIFYAYVWPVQSPSIVELFSLYARDDAKLCLINSYNHKNMSSVFNLKSYESFFDGKL